MSKKKIIVRNAVQYKKIKKQQEQYKQKQLVVRNEFLEKVKSLLKFSSKVMSDGKVVEKYQEPLDFVLGRHPEINSSLKSIEAYEVPHELMDQIEDLASCGGCYIASIRTILIKMGKSKKEPDSILAKKLSKYSLVSTDQDVFVHEMFHAASHILNRSTRSFVDLEEEFVYTSTIDWFKQNGLSDAEIINNNFLPFVLQDVIKHDFLDHVVQTAEKLNIKLSPSVVENRAKSKEFIENNVDVFVSSVLKSAIEKGERMVNQGSCVYKSSDKDRFETLDFD